MVEKGTEPQVGAGKRKVAAHVPAPWSRLGDGPGPIRSVSTRGWNGPPPTERQGGGPPPHADRVSLTREWCRVRAQPCFVEQARGWAGPPIRSVTTKGGTVYCPGRKGMERGRGYRARVQLCSVEQARGWAGPPIRSVSTGAED